MKHLKRLLVLIGVMTFANGPAIAGEYDLHQAVLDNDLQRVNRLLNKGKAIDVIGSRKYGYGSALHLAVREGHVEIAKLLLDRGAEVDVLDLDDFTPLHNAAWNGNLDMTELLIAAGADINASTYDGDTPLTLAQNNDQAQIAGFIQAKLQPAPPQQQISKDPGVIDVSGTYLVDASGDPALLKYIVTGNPRLSFEGSPVFELIQNGDHVTATMITGTREFGPIYGVIDEHTVIVNWEHARSKLTINPGGKALGGTVVYSGGDNISGIAELKLTKVESDTAPIPDISGTYISETTASGSGMNHELIKTFEKLNGKLIVLEQTGNTITGSANAQSDWIPRAREIKGTRDGNIISFYIIKGNEINGSWEINADATKLEGKWFTNGAGGASGKWNLKRVK